MTAPSRPSAHERATAVMRYLLDHDKECMSKGGIDFAVGRIARAICEAEAAVFEKCAGIASHCGVDADGHHVAAKIRAKAKKNQSKE